MIAETGFQDRLRRIALLPAGQKPTIADMVRGLLGNSGGSVQRVFFDAGSSPILRRRYPKQPIIAGRNAVDMVRRKSTRGCTELLAVVLRRYAQFPAKCTTHRLYVTESALTGDYGDPMVRILDHMTRAFKA